MSLRDLYSKMQVLNAHTAFHAADDVIAMGCNFSRISAFPFENFLGKITSLIRTPNRPVSQIFRRIHELSQIDPPMPKLPYKIHILKFQELNIFKLKYKEYTLTTKSPNNFVMLKNRLLFEIKEITRTPEGIKIQGSPWRTKRSLLVYPTDSKDLFMWELQIKPSNEQMNFNIKCIKLKMVQLEMNLKERSLMRVYYMPLFHHQCNVVYKMMRNGNCVKICANK